MKGFEHSIYYLLLVISNVIAIFLLVSAYKWPRVSRLSFFILFAWACQANWSLSISAPVVYLDYADFTWSKTYAYFINGWFANHIGLSVGIIATCQGLIAISLLLKGVVYKIGSIGAIVFLIAIVPFGLGSGFPCTIIMSIALGVLLKNRGLNFIWRKNNLLRPAYHNPSLAANQFVL
jgi:hypothetical protein